MVTPPCAFCVSGQEKPVGESPAIPEKQKIQKKRGEIRSEPRRFIAQEIIDFLDLPIMDGGEKVPRKADLRAFVLSSGDDTKVWASGLTRFSRNPDSFVVNSSQGGGFKDTWVLSR